MVTCWSHRAQEAKLAPEKCSVCGLNPKLPENKGSQLYACDKCEALVCSEDSENGPRAGNVFCKRCYLEEVERYSDHCCRCDAVISATRAARFSVCATCDPSTADVE